MTLKDEHRIILKLLNEKPLTIEELKEKSGFELQKLTNELQELLKLNFIEKDGYPTRYSIKKEIADEVRKRKATYQEDSFKIRISSIIAAKGLHKELLEKALSARADGLKAEKDLRVYSLNVSKVEEEKAIKPGEEDQFSGFIELDCTVKDLSSLVNFIFKYSPISLEILKPDKLDIQAGALQDSMLLLMDFVDRLNVYISKTMTQQQVADYNKELFDKLL